MLKCHSCAGKHRTLLHKLADIRAKCVKAEELTWVALLSRVAEIDGLAKDGEVEVFGMGSQVTEGIISELGEQNKED